VYGEVEFAAGALQIATEIELFSAGQVTVHASQAFVAFSRVRLIRFYRQHYSGLGGGSTASFRRARFGRPPSACSNRQEKQEVGECKTRMSHRLNEPRL